MSRLLLWLFGLVFLVSGFVFQVSRLAFWVCGWTDRWTDGQANGRTGDRTDGWTCGQTGGRADARADGRTDGRTFFLCRYDIYKYIRWPLLGRGHQAAWDFVSADLLFSRPFPASSPQSSVCQSSILSNLSNGSPGTSQLVIGALSKGRTQGGSHNPSKLQPVPRALPNNQNGAQGIPKGSKGVPVRGYFWSF